jgi:cytidylate kinase
VARELGYTYLDTGAMYRAAARYARECDLLEASDDRLAEMLDDFHMEFVRNPDTQHSDMWIDGVNREMDIRSTELALAMRPVVVCRPLRARLVELQQDFGRMGDIVADGRDMGTVVFPYAEYKYFLTCDLDVRLRRRIQQLQQQ